MAHFRVWMESGSLKRNTGGGDTIHITTIGMKSGHSLFVTRINSTRQDEIGIYGY